jgi:Holliday junction DNA helicase RuvB
MIESGAARGDLSRHVLPDEALFEERLRPRTLAEMIGQDRLRENLTVFIRAARARGETLDHVLFHGPPGLGKTSLAGAVANELGAPLRTTSGPRSSGPAISPRLLLEPRGRRRAVHRRDPPLAPAVEEILYPAMEDFQLDLLIGEGIGRARCGSICRASRWSARRRARACSRRRCATASAGPRGSSTTRPPTRADPGPLGARARDRARSRGARRARAASRGYPARREPPVAPGRDFAEVEGGRGESVNGELARFALERLEVDRAGFDRLDRLVMIAIVERFGGGPVGLETLAAAVGEDKGTLEDVVEPFLIHEGFLARTPRGRIATPLCFRHLGRELPDAAPGQRKLL